MWSGKDRRTAPSVSLAVAWIGRFRSSRRAGQGRLFTFAGNISRRNAQRQVTAPLPPDRTHQGNGRSGRAAARRLARRKRPRSRSGRAWCARPASGVAVRRSIRASAASRGISGNGHSPRIARACRRAQPSSPRRTGRWASSSRLPSRSRAVADAGPRAGALAWRGTVCRRAG